MPTHSRLLPSLLVLLALAMLPRVAEAQLQAHFRAERLWYDRGNGSDAQDCDTCVSPFCDYPTCELYFSMGVFSGSQRQGQLHFYKSSCGATDHESGWWNFTDQVISRSIPDGSTGATLYFSLMDEDGGLNFTDNDLLGTHTRLRSSPATSLGEYNNDVTPSGYNNVTCNNDSLQDHSRSSRFYLQYSVGFTDSSAPTTPGTPVHSDGANDPWDWNGLLYFSWAAASDPHSGVASYEVQLAENGRLVSTQDIGNLTGGLVCEGCTIDYPVVTGNYYHLRVHARNGGNLDVTPPSWVSPLDPPRWSSYSSWSSAVFVDTTHPTSSISAPAANSWHRADFDVTFNDTDDHLSVCQYQVVTDGSGAGSAWQTRDCNESPGTAISVGSGAGDDCDVQGDVDEDVCWVYGRALDAAGNISSTTSREFAIDYTGDAITSLAARETSTVGSPAVPNAYGWTQDPTPYFTWSITAANEISQVNRWYRHVDSWTGCSGSYASTSSNSGAYSSGSLSQGSHTFYVAARDAAGNCGPVRWLSFGIDHTADDMSHLDYAGNGQWINAVPTVTWDDTVPDHSRILGYSWGLTDPGDSCSGWTDTLSTVPSGLIDGPNTFFIRPVDAALNCGNVSTLTIQLDRQEEAVRDLVANGGAITAGVFHKDATPTMSWNAPSPASVSPLLGYSWDVVRPGDVDPPAAPDCLVDVSAPATSATFSATQGSNLFRVRAVDAAGNCGPVETFDVWVDSMGDSIPDIWALNDTGDEIDQGDWQQDADPAFHWEAPVIGDPDTQSDHVGYVMSIDSTPPDCGDEPTTPTTYTPDPALSDGEHTFYVSAVDAAGNCGTPALFHVKIDTADPVIAGLAGWVAGEEIDPEGAWQNELPEMRWSESASRAPIVGYSWDTAPISGCPSPALQTQVALTSLSQGANTFYIQALDEAGNCGPVKTYTLNYDTVLPTAAITSPPAFSWQNTDFNATFSDSDPNLTTCQIQVVSDGTGVDPDAWQARACNAAATVTVGAGAGDACSLQGDADADVCWVYGRTHDAAGNVSATAQRAFAIDYTGDPIASLSGRESSAADAPAVPNAYGWTQVTTPTFDWAIATAGEVAPVTRWYHDVDDIPGCSGSYISTADDTGSTTSPSLGQGSHTFYVRAYDAATNCGPYRPLSFAVDYTRDDMSHLDYEGRGSWINAVPTIEWDDTVPDHAPILGYSWGLSDPGDSCSPWTDTLSVTPTGLIDGPNTFFIRPVDAALNCGNVSTLTIQLDRWADAVTNVVGNGGAITEGVFQNDPTPTMSWDVPVPASVSPLLGYSWDVIRPTDVDPPDEPDCTADVLPPATSVTFDATEGANLFRVRAVDAAGNCGPVETFHVWVDSLGEEIPAVGARDDGGFDIEERDWQRDADPTFYWSAPPIDDPTRESLIAGYAFAIDELPDCPPADVAATVRTYTPPDSSLSDDSHTFYVAAVDAAGNCGPAAPFEVYVDTEPDEIVGLDGYLDGDAIDPTGAWVKVPPEMRWEDSVSVSPIVGYSFGTSPISGCPSPVLANAATPTSLLQGENTFYVQAKDDAGNCGPVDTYFIRYDSVAESIIHLDGRLSDGTLMESGDYYHELSPTMAWTADASTSPLRFSTDLGGTGADCVADTAVDETSSPLGPLPEGEYQRTFEVRPVDEANNCGEALSFVVGVDTVGDTVSDLAAFTEPGGDPIPSNDAAVWQPDRQPFFSWAVTSPGAPNASFSLSMDDPALDCGGPGATVVTEAGYAWPGELDDGVHTFRVRALDSAGNCGPVAALELWVAASAPAVTITSLTPNPAREGAELSIRVHVEADPPIPAAPTLTVAGTEVEPSGALPGGDYTYDYVVTGLELPEGVGEGDVEIVASAVSVTDFEGRDTATVHLDFVPPGLVDLHPDLDVDILIVPHVATTGAGLDISFESTEPLSEALPTLLVAGDNPALFQSKADNQYAYTYEVLGSEGEGAVDVSLEMVDLAGNRATFVTTWILDLTQPEVEVTTPEGGERVVLDLGDTFEVGWETTDANPGVVSIYLSRTGDEPFDERIASDIEDTGSFLWTASGEETTSAIFLVRATDLAGLSGEGRSLYPVRVRDPIADHVLMTREAREAAVDETAQARLQVVDLLGDDVDAAVSVTVTVDGSATFVGSSLADLSIDGNTVSGITASDGSATVLLSDEVAETVTLTPSSTDLPAVRDHIGTDVTFTAQAADHLVVTVDDGVADVGTVERLTIIAVDALGNPSASDVEIRLQATGEAAFSASDLRSVIGLSSGEIYGRLNSNGRATADLTDPVAEAVIVTGASDSLANVEPDVPADVLFVQLSDVDPMGIEVVAEPPRVLANDVAYSLITVTPHNLVGDRLGGGFDVEVRADGGHLDEVEDLGDGTYQTRLRSADCYDDPVRIDVRVEDVLVLDAAEVTFTCAAVADAELSADPTTILADGETCAEVTLVLYDEDGEVMTEEYVAISSSYGEVGWGDDGAVADDDGVYRATVCSSVCANDPIEVRVAVDGVPLTDIDDDLLLEIAVECLGVDPQASTLEADPLSIVADGLSASSVTVTPVRLDGTLMESGLVVAIETTLGELTAVFDEGDGTYTSQLTSEQPGEAILTAEVSGVPLDVFERVTVLPVRLPTDAVRLQAGDLSGSPQSFQVPITIFSELDRAIDDFSIRLAVHPDVEVDPVATRWSRGDASVTFDGAHSEWVVDLGDLAIDGGDDGAPQLTVSLRAPNGLPEGAQLVARAYQLFDPISEPIAVPLVFEGSLPGPAPTADACSCQSTAPVPPTLLVALVALGLAVVFRRRRSRGAT